MNLSKTSNNDSFAENQYNKMVNTPVSKLITSLAIPTVISMLVTAIYNMADTFFVSQISTQASAAVGVVFPIMSIIQAFGFTLGMGSGSLISIRLGQKRNEEANVIVSTAFFTAICLGCIITILGTLFSAQFLSLVGASDSVLPYAKAYAKYIFFGAPIMTASFVLNNVLRSEGKAFFSMIGLTTGGILNIILDPIFIYTLDLGISGAAIATLCSQFISFLILLTCFLKHKTVCRINIKLYSLKKEVLPKIVTTGFPSLSRQGLASISSILLNTAAGSYGDAAIAGMSITTKIIMFVASVMIGIGQGFSPVSGYNYGAKRYDRVEKGSVQGAVMAVGVSTTITALILIFGRYLMGMFTTTEELIDLGMRMMCILAPGYIAVGLSQSSSGVMRGAGDTMTPMWISLITTVALRVPVAYGISYLTRTPELPTGRSECIFVSLLVSWCVGALLNLIAYKRGGWKQKAVQ